MKMRDEMGVHRQQIIKLWVKIVHLNFQSQNVIRLARKKVITI